MPEATNSGSVLTLSEAAAFVGVSERTLSKETRLGHVPGQKVGREWRFSRSALESWLSQGGPAPASAAGTLTGAPPDRPPPTAEAGIRDTAFTQNRQEPVHRWVPWIAGFSSSFVDGLLSQIPTDPAQATVLDPFAGVGTTLVEAMLQGYNAVGFEINPFAALACQAKLGIPECDVGRLRERTAGLAQYLAERVPSPTRAPESAPPAEFASRVPFFSPQVLRQVLFVRDYLGVIPEPPLRDLFRTALGSVMVSFSNYSYEPSLGRREAAGKPDVLEADVAQVLSAKLTEIAGDVELAQARIVALGHVPARAVHTASYLSSYHLVPAHSVDCLITSPPYLNNYHYVRNTRPQLWWLGLVESRSDLKALEWDSFGKFWQTVRSGPPVELEVDLPELRATLEQLSATNTDRGAYGGPGWANYAASYFNDCAAFCRATGMLLRPGGLAAVVIGNNILQGIEIQTDRLLAGIAQRAGLAVEGIHRVRKKRTGSSIINSSVRVGEGKHTIELYESAVLLRTPG